MYTNFMNINIKPNPNVKFVYEDSVRTIAFRDF
jgi:hypothetical protein